MSPIERARQDQLLNAINMASARLRSMFATVLQASQRAAQGFQVEADLRIVGADISAIHDWLQDQLTEAMSDTPLASTAGSEEIIARGIPEPVEMVTVKH
ncbi:hypothetical protein WK07_09970 [Burkholderia multivorans]|uniref:hypothetical protein n=1 Tax=Burkholderia multivorans TaxID=87883 RepID=UPI000756CFFB|nr:hypothetical protein [Burkholderia multivorans]KVQ82433.1 hypothetical protein WK07_09970 [Burkholderia multivorans]